MASSASSGPFESSSTVGPESPQIPAQFRGAFEAGVDLGQRERAAMLAESDVEADRREARAIARRTPGMDPADPAKHVGKGLAARMIRSLLSARNNAQELADRFAEDDEAQLGGSRLFTLVIGAVALGLTIIVLLLMILISGEFSAAIPSTSDFASAANATRTNGETSFEIMAVSTLVVPVIIVVGLLVGAFVSQGGVTGGGRGR